MGEIPVAVMQELGWGFVSSCSSGVAPGPNGGSGCDDALALVIAAMEGEEDIVEEGVMGAMAVLALPADDLGRTAAGA